MTETVPDIALDAGTWTMVRNHSFFDGIDDVHLNNILPFFRLETILPGTIFMEEGIASTQDLYLILSGESEVIKKVTAEEISGQPHDHFTIATIHGGDVLGELSFTRGYPRSASIRCIQKSTLLALAPENFARMQAGYSTTATRIMKNLVGYVSERLRQTSGQEVKALRLQVENSRTNSRANLFFSYVIGMLCVYNLLIHYITTMSLDATAASVISASIILIFGGVLVLMIIQSKVPARHFGITMKNWKPATLHALRWTAVIVAGMIAIKWLLIQNVTRYQHLPLFDFDPANQKYLIFSFALYGLHSPVQEFISRGVLQGSLQRFFTGKNITLRAIVVSNALFSATHVHLLNGLLGLIVFVPGLFWGWLYARHDTLIGVSVSHLIIGWTAIFFLNLESLL